MDTSIYIWTHLPGVLSALRKVWLDVTEYEVDDVTDLPLREHLIKTKKWVQESIHGRGPPTKMSPRDGKVQTRINKILFMDTDVQDSIYGHGCTRFYL